MPDDNPNDDGKKQPTEISSIDSLSSNNQQCEETAQATTTMSEVANATVPELDAAFIEEEVDGGGTEATNNNSDDEDDEERSWAISTIDGEILGSAGGLDYGQHKSKIRQVAFSEQNLCNSSRSADDLRQLQKIAASRAACRRRRVQPPWPWEISHQSQLPWPWETNKAEDNKNKQNQQPSVQTSTASTTPATSAKPLPSAIDQDIPPAPTTVFNKYPAPVFTKTVLSARASQIKRGLEAAAARRTKVNNDLRDELNRIIQFAADQRNLQQQVSDLAANSAHSPTVSVTAKTAKLQARPKTDSRTNQIKGDNVKNVKFGPSSSDGGVGSVDGHLPPQPHPAEMCPSFRPAPPRFRTASPPNQTLATVEALARRAAASVDQQSCATTPPNSAAPTRLTSSVIQGSQRMGTKQTIVQDNRSHPMFIRGVLSIRPRANHHQITEQASASEGTSTNPSEKIATSVLLQSQARPFIACVVSQNFALKLLQEGETATNSVKAKNNKNKEQQQQHILPATMVSDNYFTGAFGVRRSWRHSRSYSRNTADATMHQQ